jgi:membrane associated rhomboid family serine protease
MAPPSRRFSFALPSFNTVSAKFAGAIVLFSALAAVLARNADISLYLSPGEVLKDFTLWQLLTYIPVAERPMSVLFAALIMWSMGGALESWWGPKRMFAVLFTVMVVAAVVTVGGAALYRPLRGVVFTGAWALAGATWVLYGLNIGRGEANFWGIPMTGNALAAIGALFVALDWAFRGWEAVVPDAVALGMSFVYVRYGGPGKLWGRVQSFLLERQVRRRSRRLSVISGERNMRSDSDRYLH